MLSQSVLGGWGQWLWHTNNWIKHVKKIFTHNVQGWEHRYQKKKILKSFWKGGVYKKLQSGRFDENTIVSSSNNWSNLLRSTKKLSSANVQVKKEICPTAPLIHKRQRLAGFLNTWETRMLFHFKLHAHMCVSFEFLVWYLLFLILFVSVILVLKLCATWNIYIITRF